VSGKILAMQRSEFKEMIRYLDTHKEINTIYVYELSRMGRNLLDAITTFIQLEERGYRIKSLSEPWTHTEDPAMRKFMIMIVSWLNEQELHRLSDRTKEGMARVKKYGSKSGNPIGRPAIIPDKETVEKLKADGKKWGEIAAIFRMDVTTLYRYRKVWKRKELGRS
jgi:DNA invertase Pin-like site-specific DNA recombinase